jgi:hypothetical protein
MKDSSPNGMVTLPVNKDFFWSMQLQGMAFGSTQSTNTYTFEEGLPYTILDTGSSHLFVPLKYFETIIVKIIEAAGNPYYIIQNGVAYTTCMANFQPLYFMFSDYWIQINPEEYLLDVSENHDGSVCHIEVLPNTYGFFLLGQPIFQGYYTHHDMDA